jgi:hypothetical protein
MAKMRVLTPEGVDGREIDDPTERSNLGRYWNDMRHYLHTGDEERLRRHEGEVYGGIPAIVDPDVIDEFAFEDLEFEGTLYEARSKGAAEPLGNDLRSFRRAGRVDGQEACTFCLETDIEVLAPRRVRRTLLQSHHIVLGRNDADLELVLCLNCHAKAHAGLLGIHIDPKDQPPGLLERLSIVLRALGSFFGQLAHSAVRWAERLEDFMEALDVHFPDWRQLGEVVW